MHFLHIVPFPLLSPKGENLFMPFHPTYGHIQTHPGHAPAFLSPSGLLTQRWQRKACSHGGNTGSVSSLFDMLADSLPVTAEGVEGQRRRVTFNK